MKGSLICARAIPHETSPLVVSVENENDGLCLAYMWETGWRVAWLRVPRG
jgi:hypothetical protein